jgi:hypothetical protein
MTGTSRLEDATVRHLPAGRQSRSVKLSTYCEAALCQKVSSLPWTTPKTKKPCNAGLFATMDGLGLSASMAYVLEQHGQLHGLHSRQLRFSAGMCGHHEELMRHAGTTLLRHGKPAHQSQSTQHHQSIAQLHRMSPHTDFRRSLNESAKARMHDEYLT